MTKPITFIFLNSLKSFNINKIALGAHWYNVSSFVVYPTSGRHEIKVKMVGKMFATLEKKNMDILQVITF